MFGLNKLKLGTMGKLALACLGIVLVKGAIDAFIDYDKGSRWKGSLATFAAALAIGLAGGFIVEGKGAFMGNMMVAGAAVAGLQAFSGQVEDWGKDLGAGLKGIGGSATPQTQNKPTSQTVAYSTPGATTGPATISQPTATQPATASPTQVIQQAAKPPSTEQMLIQYGLPALGQIGSSLIGMFAPKPATTGTMGSGMSGVDLAAALYAS